MNEAHLMKLTCRKEVKRLEQAVSDALSHYQFAKQELALHQQTVANAAAEVTSLRNLLVEARERL